MLAILGHLRCAITNSGRDWARGDEARPELLDTSGGGKVAYLSSIGLAYVVSIFQWFS